MAENKMGPNIQAGAGFLAKRVQKSLSRAQEKVLQKLGKTMETKDEQFEQCFQNLNKQQTDGGRLYKDVKAYHTAVKVMHESSKRLSQTLRDVYESDWQGGEDLSVIMESEDLLWNDYEEKLTDQIVRTMENYTSQFPEVKERVAKRGRKLVDYDSARHHLEAFQSAKKKDDAKVAKAEEEFNKAQNVFEEINKELREELPVLHQSRIGCYFTVFQNISNLRDVFYKEMSVLNHELYNVMKKLETQHSGKAFIIKGLHSTKSTKNRKSLVISNPIPCNTAFPNDHVSIHSTTENGNDSGASDQCTLNVLEEPGLPEEGSNVGADIPSKEDVDASDSDDLGSNDLGSNDFGSNDLGSNDVNTLSLCDSESGGGGDGSTGGQNPEEVEPDMSHSDDSGVEVPRPDVMIQEVGGASESADGDVPQNPEQERTPHPAPKKAKAKPPPVPAPRISFRSTDRCSLSPAKTGQVEEKGEMASQDSKTDTSETPPGFLYKAVALESNAASEDGLLQFEQGEVVLVLTGPQEEGMLKGITEESWNRHKSVDDHSGTFLEKLIQPIQAEAATYL